MTISTCIDDVLILTTGSTTLIDDEVDTASKWASKHIFNHPAYKWVVGNYVEADNANRNGQYWSLDDLRINHVSVRHAPMNVGHNYYKPIGTYVASEIVYPTDNSSKAFIETAAVIWKARFPEIAGALTKAFAEGSLSQSMECVAESITCVGDEACGETFVYDGPFSRTYCDHIQSRKTNRQFNNPLFMGGGLLLPPDKPGWSGADMTEMAELLETPEAESIVAQAETSEEAAGYDPEKWESLMHMLVLKHLARSDNGERASKAGRLLGLAVASNL